MSVALGASQKWVLGLERPACLGKGLRVLPSSRLPLPTSREALTCFLVFAAASWSPAGVERASEREWGAAWSRAGLHRTGPGPLRGREEGGVVRPPGILLARVSGPCG